MAVYTLVPSDNIVLINGEAANDVSFAGINPSIHCVQWYGTVGEVEYVYDPINQTKAPNERITSMAPYQVYLDQAQTIIYAQNNPVTYYSTSATNTYEGLIYPLGAPIVISTPNTPQPAQTTLSLPPAPESFQTLYWYANAWVISSVDPNLSLPAAKSALIDEARTSGAANVDYQARIYSVVDLFAAADVTALASADYSGLTLGDYQTYIDGEVSSVEAQVNAATTVPALYNLNPEITANPN
jgi:hypothetical protein